MDIKKIMLNINSINELINEIKYEIKYNADILDQCTDMLELSVRSANCLKAENILTIRDLVYKSEEEMLLIPNFGRKSLNEIKESLFEKELCFGMGETSC